MRLHAERALRIAGLLAIAGWVALALRPPGTAEVVSESALASALPRWTMQRVERVHVRVDTVPDHRSRDWLRALRRAGSAVSWSAAAIAPLGLETIAATEPAGGALVLAAAGRGEGPVLSDALGAIDTIDVASGAGAVRLSDVRGAVTLTSGVQPARASVASAPLPRRVYVSGAASWESKFVIAALEEAGWQVDASLFVGPGHHVTQGVSAVLDTARHSAAIVLDTLARVAGEVDRFVRQGGGLVIVGDANRGALAQLGAWRVGRRQAAPLGTLPGDTLWRGLSRVPFDSVEAAYAIPLELRDGKAIVVARRYYAGRVVGVGYDETWRWRMAGGDDAVAAHRQWWSRLVGSVAMRSPLAAEHATGAAPRADLHASLGPAVTTSLRPARIPRPMLANLLGAIAFAALLAEWLLRRARGAR